MNEFLPDRNEQISIPYTEQMLKGEQVLRIKVDELLIPYKEIIDLSKPSYPELSSCTRIEIEFKPSMFEYFFPYELHRSLLSSEEMKYLKSQKKAVVNVQESIKLFINEISKGYAGGHIINAHSKTAHIICYNEDKHLLSFKVYDDRYIETEDRHCFWYRGGIKSMKVLTSQIQQIRPFVFRIQCAHNLRTLWHRLRLYHKAKQMRFTHSEGLIEVSEPSPMVYPSPEKWCDSIVEANLVWGTRKSNIELHICPSAGEGRCHYAMNPNCEPNSPPDMVLLFETKAGWNQHGGEELFTFDNHDHKGGCVLLNNGTVKFICTEDELHALRWKY